MVLYKKYCLNIFNFFFVFIISVIYDPNKTSAAGQGILADYYWGSNEIARLRSTRLTCDDTVVEIGCLNKCGKHFICENNECKCLDDQNTFKISVRTADDYKLFHDNQYLYSKENEMPRLLRAAIKDDESEETKSNDFRLEESIPVELILAKENKEKLITDRPVLRHHIAHFCPNLKDARTCIRKCMAAGLPAFCGKDHVCYCGHRYTSHDGKVDIDKKQVNMEFKDIYEKYFGPKIFEMDGYED